MNSLYKISTDLIAILNELDDNGGEITPELEQALAITQEQFAAKATDYAHAIINIEAMAKAAKEEKDRLAKLQKHYETTAKRLRGAISQAMTTFDIPKVENGSLRLSLRHTKAVDPNIDMSVLPKEFKVVKVEEVPDKEKIKEAILAGETVEGASLIDNYNLQIR